MLFVVLFPDFFFFFYLSSPGRSAGSRAEEDAEDAAHVAALAPSSPPLLNLAKITSCPIQQLLPQIAGHPPGGGGTHWGRRARRWRWREPHGPRHASPAKGQVLRDRERLREETLPGGRKGGDSGHRDGDRDRDGSRG